MGKNKDREIDSSWLWLLQHGICAQYGKKWFVNCCLQPGGPSLCLFTLVSTQPQSYSGPCEDNCWRRTYSQSASLKTRAKSRHCAQPNHHQSLLGQNGNSIIPLSFFFLWWLRGKKEAVREMYPNIPVAGQQKWRSVLQGLQSDSCKTASLALYRWIIARKITRGLCSKLCKGKS